MIRSFSRFARLGLAAALLASAAASPAQNSPADRLSGHLRELARNPNSLSALIGAGQAALAVGDVNAALGFFARADEQAPRNGQIKAGLARALLMNGNPRDALRMFDAARDLGVPDAELAGDRGLAYDLRGDQKRAQRDYALALARAPNDEVTRRYALSLGITGDREAAIRLLDPLLYKRDQAAWRARAFVLALTGDQAGAGQIVRQVMPERMAVAMTPFLARLPSLKPGEKAAAVHFGEMPSDGTRYAAAEPLPYAPVYQAPARRIEAPAPTPTPARESRDPRRRPGGERLAQAAPVPTPTPTPVAPLPEQQRGDLASIMRDIRTAAQEDGQRRFGTPAPRPSAAKATPTPVAKAGRGGADKEAELKKAAAAKDDPKKTAAKAPEPKGKAAAAKAAKEARAAKEAEAAKNAPRIWVQVASGSNAAAMPREWERVRARAGAALKGRTPSTAPGRLLVGPFKTDDEAQALVNQLRKAGLSTFQWDSPKGTKISSLGKK